MSHLYHVRTEAILEGNGGMLEIRTGPKAGCSYGSDVVFKHSWSNLV